MSWHGTAPMAGLNCNVGSKAQSHDLVTDAVNKVEWMIYLFFCQRWFAADSSLASIDTWIT